MTFHYLLVPIKVTGASMQPTYRDGSVNFINRVSYMHKNPKRGDVVILHEGRDLIIKRVIGLPGERITLDRGVFKIDGIPLVDQFSNIPVYWEIRPVTLGPDDFYVIGDNRRASIFGKFKRSEILGKAVF